MADGMGVHCEEVVDTNKFIDHVTFHKSLARLWRRLDKNTQEELGNGVAISDVMDKLSSRLAEINRSNCCKKSATLSFL